MNRNLKRLLGGALVCALLVTGLTIPASAARFTDVPANYWAADAISRCAELGLFQGKSATRFGVGEPMSRGSFAVVLCRLFGWETEDPSALPYTDVPADAWYAPAVAAALRHGAITVQTEEFRPGEPLTREELAAALVRGLGYGTIAGLSQELTLPFTDVDTNRGYITMAWDLGLVNGTSATTFSPEKRATREQCAVMLMRLYDKLHREHREQLGIVTSGEDLPELTGFTAVALGRKQLISGGKPRVVGGMGEEELTAVRATLRETGVKQLVYVAGSAADLTGTMDAEAVADALIWEVNKGGYDGLLLDFPALRSDKTQMPLNQLVSALRTRMGSRLLYLAVEAPDAENTYAGYNYPSLAHKADRLVLRVNSAKGEAASMAVAPVQPLEGVYEGLRQLRDLVSTEKVVLWMNTAATVWEGTREETGLTGLEIDAILQEEDTQRYYSSRYACSYLLTEQEGKTLTVWYPDAASSYERSTMGRLFGVSGVCLSELSGMSPTLLEGLN